MNPLVTSVSALDDYELELFFGNGEIRRFDIKPYLDLSYDTLYLGGQPIPAPARAEKGHSADA